MKKDRNNLNKKEAGEVKEEPKKEYQQFVRDNILYGSIVIKIGITDDGKPIYDELETWKIRDLDFIPWLNWKPEEKTKSNIFRSRDQDGVSQSWIKNNDGTVGRLD
jgi:hypothetical protein